MFTQRAFLEGPGNAIAKQRSPSQPPSSAPLLPTLEQAQDRDPQLNLSLAFLQRGVRFHARNLCNKLPLRAPLRSIS